MFREENSHDCDARPSSERSAGELLPPPIARFPGHVVKSIDPGSAVFEMEADERHHDPMATLHGGVYCDLADAAMCDRRDEGGFIARQPRG